MLNQGRTWFPTEEAQRSIDAERNFDEALQESQDAREALRKAITHIETADAETHWLERALWRLADPSHRAHDHEVR